jgi:hypothetical protein
MLEKNFESSWKSEEPLSVAKCASNIPQEGFLKSSIDIFI